MRRPDSALLRDPGTPSSARDSADVSQGLVRARGHRRRGWHAACPHRRSALADRGPLRSAGQPLRPDRCRKRRARRGSVAGGGARRAGM